MTILDVKELSALLRVKSGTIRCWVSQGTIPYVKLGPGEKGLVRFDLQRIEAWVKSNLRRERRLMKRQSKGKDLE